MSDHPGNETWQIFKVISEFVDGFEILMNAGPAISFFGGARFKPDHKCYEMTVTIAKKLAENGFTVISGGGPGIMEAANKGAKEGNGVSIGLNIKLPREQHPNKFLDKMVTFRYFFVRKVMFVKYAMGFIIMPGGFGTMDEFMETLTLIQTGKIAHFPIVLFGKDYWDGLLDWFNNTMLPEGAISEEELKIFYHTDDPDDAVNYILERAKHKPTLREGEIRRKGYLG